MTRILTAALALGLSTALAHAAPLRDVLEEKGEYDTFLKALDASDAGWFLEEDEPYTVFVPTDAAFEALPEGVLDALLTDENRPKLNAILEGHVIPDGEVKAADLSDGQNLDPATGEPLAVSIDGDAVTVAEIAVCDRGRHRGRRRHRARHRGRSSCPSWSCRR